MSGVQGGYSLSDLMSEPAVAAVARMELVISSNLELVRLRWLVNICRVRARILLALARCVIISMPECPPCNPLIFKLNN